MFSVSEDRENMRKITLPRYRRPLATDKNLLQKMSVRHSPPQRVALLLYGMPSEAHFQLCTDLDCTVTIVVRMKVSQLVYAFLVPTISCYMLEWKARHVTVIPKSDVSAEKVIA